MMQGWSRSWPWAHCITCPNHEYKSSGLLVVPVNLAMCCNRTLFKLWAAPPAAGISVRGLGAVTRFSLAAIARIDSFTMSRLACNIRPRAAQFPSAGSRRARCRVRLLISLLSWAMSACPAVSGLAKTWATPAAPWGKAAILFCYFLLPAQKESANIVFLFYLPKMRSRRISSFRFVCQK